mmetsp:Transcript_17908/g.27700  ORF Transcript_17908/g.27700 Transcript_17908/m.27700 type:complete len:204 (+) Transcript_17908:1670-2281(+)
MENLDATAIFEGGSTELQTLPSSKNLLTMSKRVPYPPPQAANPYLSIRNSFSTVKLGFCFKLWEPVFGRCFWLCHPCKRKQKFVKKAIEKLEGELDIESLLKKVRLSDQMWRNILLPEQLKVLNYSTGGVVSIKKRPQNSSSSSSPSSSEEEELFHRAFKDVQGGWVKQDKTRQIFNEAVFNSVPLETKEQQSLIASHLFRNF